MEKITIRVGNSSQEHEKMTMKTEEAFLYLGISRTTFYKLVKDGKIPFTEIGSVKLYRVSDLDEFLRPKGTIEKAMQPIISAIKKEYGHGRK